MKKKICCTKIVIAVMTLTKSIPNIKPCGEQFRGRRRFKSEEKNIYNIVAHYWIDIVRTLGHILCLKIAQQLM